MFYAAVNSYATQTSIGFSNTWSVLGFASRQMRDAYVKRATDLATQAIAADEVRAFGGKRGQVSFYDASGKLHQHTERGEFTDGGVTIDPVTAEVLDSWSFHGFTD